MTGPIRILHVFGRMQRGGAEMRTLELMRHIDRSKFHLEFCGLSGLPGDLEEEIRALGGDVNYCRLGPALGWRFRRLLRSRRFAVVHAHVHLSSGFFLRLAAKERVPVRIAHFRTTDDGQWNTLRRKLQRKVMQGWVDRYATNILAVSEEVMEAAWGARRFSDPRCAVIYNGLDLTAFEKTADRTGVRRSLGISAEASLFIHVGSMQEAKNHLRLLSIFAEVRRREPTARLLLVGRSESRIEAALRRRIDELGVVDSVVFAGERADVPQLLQAADVLLFPSVREGLPGAVLEACAAGTPVIASDLPAIKEIASRLPGIHCLSLDKPDGEWASVAGQFLATAVTPRILGRTNVVKESVFSIEECVQACTRIWEGTGP